MAYKVKICGNKYLEDSLMVASCAPDFMGWIFSPFSPRQISFTDSLKQIETIRKQSPQISHVAVFANNPAEEVLQAWEEPYLSIFKYVQLVDSIDLRNLSQVTQILRNRSHRIAEPLRRCIPAIRVAAPLSDQDIWTAQSKGNVDSAPFFILDSFVKDKLGGTGHSIPPLFLEKLQKTPYLLAGGLKPSNVIERLSHTRALGADVSSGIEKKHQPGRKDEAKLRDFIRLCKGLV